jgi:NitT/TauT family transport system substrate-binding protein
MNLRRTRPFSRRKFLGSALAATASLGGLRPLQATGEPAPETTTIRVHHSLSVCLAPQYVAEELLHAEGFTEVRYVRHEDAGGFYRALSSGAADIGNDFAPPLIMHIDAGDPITILGGIHVGCFELFGTERVRAIRDLKGKNVAVRGLGLPPHVFLASMAAYVGMDPSKDINWVVHPSAEAMALLAAGKIDAFMGFPPEPQELRAKHIGHVVVRSAVDRPWSQYFCCMPAANKEFARKHPIAVKRALRAMLKATDVCALQPARAAQAVVDRGITNRYDYALQAMRDIPYGKWREFDPEDTVRFYALRLREAGMIKATPQKIIAQGTDWRFLSELKKELKA